MKILFLISSVCVLFVGASASDSNLPDWSNQPDWMASPSEDPPNWSYRLEWIEGTGWVYSGEWDPVPEYFVGDTPMSGSTVAMVIYQSMLNQAGVTTTPVPPSAMTPLGIRYRQLWRGDLSYVDDLKYRTEVIQLWRDIDQAAARRARIRNRY